MNNKIDKFKYKDDWKYWIGLNIIKHSGKPFKSGSKIEPIKHFTENSKSGKEAFELVDGSVIDCHQVKLYLLPCPFCDGEAELKIHTQITEIYRIGCSICDCSIPSLTFKEELVSRWNTRSYIVDTTKDVKKYIGNNVHYNADGQMIFCKNPEGGEQLLVDVRGWGRISQMFETQKESMELQDNIGEFITEAINQQLK